VNINAHGGRNRRESAHYRVVAGSDEVVVFRPLIDAPALCKRRTRGGALYALEPLDGATIKRLIDDWGRTPLPPPPAYQQILKGVPAVDYGADELIYAPDDPFNRSTSAAPADCPINPPLAPPRRGARGADS
jgi:hypothetical protein